MIILDENIPESQRLLLRSWRISVRQIGVDIARKGMKDDEIIPFLLTLRQPTFFTLDDGFYTQRNCHKRYCIAFLNVRQSEAAVFARRMQRQPDLDINLKRMGTVVGVSHTGYSIWRTNARKETVHSWKP